MSKGRITINYVSEPEIIRDLKGVLYDVYIEELQWQPWNEPNYSNIMVLEDEYGFYLDDDISKDSDWFEICVDGERAGVFRRIPYPKIELRRYISEDIMQNLSDNLYEFNRCALRIEYRSIPGMTEAITNATIFYTEMSGCSALIATAHPNLKRALFRSGYKVIEQFRYYPEDSTLVDLMLHEPC